MRLRVSMKVLFCLVSLASISCGSAAAVFGPYDAGEPSDDGAPAYEAGHPDEREVDADRGAQADSSSGFDGGLFGIDPQTDIQTLTGAQQAMLCDWRNAMLGGYAQSFPCGGGEVSTDESQAQCLTAIFTRACVLSLDAFEKCVRALAPTHGCNPQYDICEPVYRCYVYD